MQSQEATATKKNETQTCRSEYRRKVIAEIIDYGHAAFFSEPLFQMQVDTWNIALEEIPTDRLLGCFIKTSRGRFVSFDIEPLTSDEILSAWQTH